MAPRKPRRTDTCPTGKSAAQPTPETEYARGERGDYPPLRSIYEATLPLLALLDNTDHIAVFKDTKLRYVTVNKGYLKLTGYGSVEEVVGKTDAELFQGMSTEEQIREYMDNDRRALALPQGESITAEEGSLGPDGKIRVFLTKKFPVFDPRNTLVGVGTLTLEITERKQAEQALRDSKERFQALVENTHDLFWSVDRNGTYTYISPRAMDLLGYSPEELEGACLYSLVSREAGRVRALFKAMLAKKRPLVGLEITQAHKNGGHVILETNATPILDEQGAGVGYRGVSRDITKRKQVEAELQKMWRAVEFSPASIVITDLLGAIEYTNPQFTELTGYSQAEARGQTPAS